MVYRVTCNFATLSIIHLYLPLNKHYYFSFHTLHCTPIFKHHTNLRTLQLSTTYTYQLITLQNSPPSLLQESSESYAIKRQQACVSPPPHRLPITTDIMHRIKETLLQQPHSYHSILMWTVCCLAFFGFLRCNEFTVPSQVSYEPTMHLSYSDISVDKCDNPSVVVVYIKRSKTDPLCRESSITLGTTQDALCPVKALMPYLATWGSQAGPFSPVRTNIT